MSEGYTAAIEQKFKYRSGDRQKSHPKVAAAATDLADTDAEAGREDRDGSASSFG